jgi:hypothetical protein
VIPKSNSHHRLVEVSPQRFRCTADDSLTCIRALQNLEVTSFDLSEAELKALSGLNLNLRLNNPVDIDPRLAIFA